MTDENPVPYVAFPPVADAPPEKGPPVEPSRRASVSAVAWAIFHRVRALPKAALFGALATLTAIILVGLALWGALRETVGPDTDAAPFYREALTKLPELDYDELKLFSEMLDATAEPDSPMPDDRAARRVLARYDDACDLIRKGSQAGRFTWRYDPNSWTFDETWPELEQSRWLMRALTLQAEIKFRAGDVEGGIRDCVAGIRFARHLTAVGTEVHSITGQGCEAAACFRLFAWMHAMTPEQRRHLDGDLASAPRCFVARDHHRNEKIYGERVWADRVACYKPDGDRDDFERLLRRVAFDEPMKETLRKATGLNIRELWRLIESQKSWWEDEDWLLHCSPAVLREQGPRREALRKGSSNPLVRDWPIGHCTIRRLELIAEVDRVMLRAALAVLDGGPAKLREFPDPVGDGPFEHRPTGDGGFELRSAPIEEDGSPRVKCVRGPTG